MSEGDVVVVRGTAGPLMCIERINERGVATVSWFWNYRAWRMEWPLSMLACS